MVNTHGIMGLLLRRVYQLRIGSIYYTESWLTTLRKNAKDLELPEWRWQSVQMLVLSFPFGGS